MPIAPAEMRKTKVLCVFSALLGNKVTTERLMDTLDKMQDVEPRYVLLTAADYAQYPAPRLARLTNPWHSRYVARQKTKALLDDGFDMLLVNSWEFVTEFGKLAKRIPAAALMDAVPATVDRQLRQRGFGGWKRTVAAQLQEFPFAQAARKFKYFLPMGSDAADALESRYRIGRDRCFVTLAPQDLDFWKPGNKSSEPVLRLLFVANDFVRKGGEFLLKLYADHLSRTCRLTIASNDPALKLRGLPSGVTLLQDRTREQLLAIYRESDLFVFPTRQDYMPQVLAEALATGVPCIASDVGGIRDLIRNGENGFLMPLDASAEEWSERIAGLHANRGELGRMSAGARAFAEEKLGAQRFEDLIRAVVEKLRLAAVPLS